MPAHRFEVPVHRGRASIQLQFALRAGEQVSLGLQLAEPCEVLALIGIDHR